MYKSNFGKETPQWFLKGSIYQINPRTFSEKGTLSEITKELPFLAELGFKVIYLCPIFQADDTMENWSPRQIESETNNPKNPYRMNDFFKIDNEYGSMDDLADLISEAHKSDLKVILDLVYLHIGPNAPVLKKHPNFAMQDEDGNTLLTEWNFPQLNYENTGLREYLWSNMTYYIGALDADGFRCDVGDEVPLDFWLEGKRRIRNIKHDAVMINEGIKKEYLQDCFDVDYAFCWHEAIYKVLSGNESADFICKEYSSVAGDSQKGIVYLRDMDNHDTVTDWAERVEVLAGHEGMELVEILNYMIDGIPMVYCGNELGDTAKLSMFANRFHMGRFETTNRTIKNECYSLRRQEIIKNLNRFKRENDILCYGNTVFVETSDNSKVIAFERCYKNKKILFVGNFSDNNLTVKIDIPKIENGKKVFESEHSTILDGNGNISLPPYGYVVFTL